MSVTGIGAAVRRKEDHRFITGAGHYTDDINRPGQAYAYFLRSLHAHAKIKSIDVKAPASMPGVLAVLTGAELAGDKIGNLICGWMIHSKDGTPMKMAPHPPLATGKVCHVGDPLTVVVAETLAEARDAGTNEFLARPLVLGQLVNRVTHALTHPRPFIRCESYIGPDRRRKARPHKGPERRRDALEKLSPSMLAKALAERVLRAGGLSIDELVTAGQEVIAAEEETYRAVRRADLRELNALARQLKEAGDGHEELIRKIHTNKIAPDDFVGTTVSLTNPGTLGSGGAADPPRGWRAARRATCP